MSAAVLCAVLLRGAAPCHAAAASIESGVDGILVTVPAGAAFMVRSANEDGTFSAPEKVVTESRVDELVGAACRCCFPKAQIILILHSSRFEFLVGQEWRVVLRERSACKHQNGGWMDRHWYSLDECG